MTWIVVLTTGSESVVVETFEVRFKAALFVYKMVKDLVGRKNRIRMNSALDYYCRGSGMPVRDYFITESLRVLNQVMNMRFDCSVFVLEEETSKEKPYE